MSPKTVLGPLASVATFAGLLVVTFAAAAAGGVASVSAADFYQSLERPSWAPPPSVFGPVWTLLYLLMTVAIYLVVNSLGWRGSSALLVLYGVQLVANALWTWLFFRWHSGPGALVDILALLVLIVAMAWRFWLVRPVAGTLILPYIAWVSFATALSWAVWRLNPGVL
jgi:translocator protein